MVRSHKPREKNHYMPFTPDTPIFDEKLGRYVEASRRASFSPPAASPTLPSSSPTSSPTTGASATGTINLDSTNTTANTTKGEEMMPFYKGYDAFIRKNKDKDKALTPAISHKKRPSKGNDAVQARLKQRKIQTHREVAGLPNAVALRRSLSDFRRIHPSRDQVGQLKGSARDDTIVTATITSTITESSSSVFPAATDMTAEHGRQRRSRQS
ncbi:hypothetical protein NUU61_002384 [Penicillium alfredii]|uniref:Uncharacterized protein n=1 Tax=Penicillium alfredii TaxID=1506179 RepID=A0A9W9FS68_9EURO|nr:uncharacterized protein NUU61_002384 [Penicillium alfredii]KAJ5105037.1 hypothetical protein NUU61_002384 [Penicillium alfredii]